MIINCFNGQSMFGYNTLPIYIMNISSETMDAKPNESKFLEKMVIVLIFGLNIIDFMISCNGIKPLK